MFTRTSALTRLLYLAFALLLSLTMTIWPAVPTLADPSPVGEVRGSSDFEEPTLPLGPAGQTLSASQETMAVGPGLNMTRFDRFDARGWVRGYVLQADFGNPAIRADLLFPGTVTAAGPLSGMAARSGAVAGVNGDFFDINSTNAPLGAEIQSGQLIKGPVPGWYKIAGVGTDRLGRLSELMLTGTVTLPAGDQPLAGLNQTAISANGIGLYTPLWGTATRAGAVAGAVQVREVVVVEGKVTATAGAVSGTPIPANGLILLGREAGAEALAALREGDPVTVQYAPSTDAIAPFAFAVGGNAILVKDGQIATSDDGDMHPRTAIGFSADGRQMLLVVVDGRQSSSRGMTMLELAQLMQSLGAHNALNLDGGGSSTFLTRLPGDPGVSVINSPSDGGERSVPNGVGIFVAPGSGRLTGLRVSPATAAEQSDRVFPGLSRRFTALGYDETYAPVAAGSVAWRALPADVGTFDAGSGVFHARKPGQAVAEAQVQSVKGTVPLRVLGELARIETDPPRLGLAPGTSGRFSVVGYDADGYAAPIEPDDVTLAYDQGLVTITPAADGSFTVVPSGEGAVLVTVSVAGRQTYLPVTVGLTTLKVADMESEAGWTFTKYPATVGAAMAVVPGHTGNGLQLNYDFTIGTATRAAYLQTAPSYLDLPDKPQRIGLWVHGDGMGAWLRMVVRDALNTNYTLNLADKVDWTGWRYVEAVVPASVQYPLRLWRIYPVETSKARQYKGQLIFDDLTVKVAASLDVPAQPVTADPLIVQGALDAARWKFAVLSDLHVAAANPGSKDVRHAREALRQALAANPEFIIIGGDFVDTAYPADFALARQILDEEVGGKVPVYYVPGNHEIMGSGNLNNFRAVFGPNRYTFDHNGTRFILLDSSTGSFRTADFQQLVDLQASLRAAAADPSIKNVVVFGHHPTRDPMPTQSSQLADPKEARLIEEWLTAFRETSGGKGALYLSGHAHGVNVQRVEGLPYMVLGSVGKTPYAPVDKGGFYSWALFGVDPTPVPAGAAGPGNAAPGSQVAGTEWIRAEVRPVLQSISLSAPPALRAGTAVMLTASGVQTGDVSFALRYPATAVWSGSENLLVSTEAVQEQNSRHAALLNPATGELKALQPGIVTVRVESGGVTAATTITIEP
ncbi:MAG TPA: phosphodiester glycosidase family protein [Symbiobacteriaceae bacterium]|nr:phosphodiester glycosidase family protein [Symbiobacteriaceae bacterium]